MYFSLPYDTSSIIIYYFSLLSFWFYACLIIWHKLYNRAPNTLCYKCWCQSLPLFVSLFQIAMLSLLFYSDDVQQRMLDHTTLQEHSQKKSTEANYELELNMRKIISMSWLLQHSLRWSSAMKYIACRMQSRAI